MPDCSFFLCSGKLPAQEIGPTEIIEDIHVSGLKSIGYFKLKSSLPVFRYGASKTPRE